MHIRSKTTWAQRHLGDKSDGSIREIDVPWIGTAEIGVRRHYERSEQEGRRGQDKLVQTIVPEGLKEMLRKSPPIVRFHGPGNSSGFTGFEVVPDGATIWLNGLVPYVISNRHMNLEKTLIEVRIGCTYAMHTVFGQESPCVGCQSSIVKMELGEPVPVPSRQSIEVAFDMSGAAFGVERLIETIDAFAEHDSLAIGLKLLGFYRKSVQVEDLL